MRIGVLETCFFYTWDQIQEAAHIPEPTAEATETVEIDEVPLLAVYLQDTQIEWEFDTQAR